MFKEVLREVLNRTEGCPGVLIMGTDGIPVERIRHSEAEETNLDVAVAEYTSLIRNAQRVNREMGLGKLGEVIFSTENGTFILRFIGEDYFVS